MIFEVTDADEARITKWLQEEVYPELRKSRKHKKIQWHDYDDAMYPYAGAIGGDITYIFTPNSLGYVTEVEEHFSKKRLNITDYSSW